MRKGKLAFLALVLTMFFTCGNLFALSLENDYGMLESIDVYEESYSSVQEITFDRNDSRLRQNIEREGISSYDFIGREKEYYDIYFSDALGNLNGECSPH